MIPGHTHIEEPDISYEEYLASMTKKQRRRTVKESEKAHKRVMRDIAGIGKKLSVAGKPSPIRPTRLSRVHFAVRRAIRSGL